MAVPSRKREMLSRCLFVSLVVLMTWPAEYTRQNDPAADCGAFVQHMGTQFQRV